MTLSHPSAPETEISSGHGRRPSRLVKRLLILAVAAVTVSALSTGAVSAAQAPSHPFPIPGHLTDPPNFGANVKIFDPSMPTAQIQATVDAIAATQVDNEMGTQRYALLFKPGTYGTAAQPLVFQVGYYTEVAGLGQSPTDVTINGHVDVYNRCLTPDNCIALDNFWRSVSNLTINVQGETGCRASAEFWAVSQAAPMRRVNITGGNLSFQDYCTAGPQYASGGFLADSKTSFIVNGSQQQFLVRNSAIGGWSNGVWNQVFAGTTGAPAETFPKPNPYTVLPTNPASREKPYLYLSAANRWNVFVPAAKTNSAGTTWANGQTPGRSISLNDFFLARPTDSVQTINSQLARGKNLIFTPGVYNIGRSIKVKRADTVVLGLGIATLTAVNGAVPLTVADVPGVDIAGIMIDAGTVNSPALLEIGTRRTNHDDDDGHGHGRSHEHSDSSNPTGVQDVFFRVGGPHVGKASASLVVNSDNVILDDIWAWRADHGTGVGWTVNTADTGVIVNGDNVTATGLFVEHFQKYNVIWNGENGKTIFFQNELPYDAPNQAAWQHDGVLGWAAYKVANSVKTHELWGGGSYIYTNVDPTLHATRGFEVPVTPGVKMHHLLTVELGAGTLDHVINDTGAPVTSAAVGVPSFVVSFP
jgi:hypothetical protein